MLIPDLEVNTKDSTIFFDVTLYSTGGIRMPDGVTLNMHIRGTDEVYDTIQLGKLRDNTHWYCELCDKYHLHEELFELINSRSLGYSLVLHRGSDKTHYVL